MSLRPQEIPPVPDETIRVAQAAFPRGNTYMLLRDEMGGIYEDVTFVPLFPKRGQPAEAPWRLALVSLMQYAEGLSDRQAADAVRSRIDWKYGLSLELTDPGFDSTVLSEFRTRLVTAGAEQQLLDRFVEICQERQLLRSGGRQRTDSTHVLAAVRVLNRLECIGETMRSALNDLALVAPQWLLEHSQAEWIERYGPRVEEYRFPSGQAKRQAYAELMGADGWMLLQAIFAADAPLWLRQIPSVKLLWQVWLQQFYRSANEEVTLQWRMEKLGLPPSLSSISSPYDGEAHHSKKRHTTWMGYKVHLSETCDEQSPHLITHVETTLAPLVDGECTPVIHAAMQKKNLLPGVHLVDSGYVYTQWLLNSQSEYGVSLLGPTRADYHWQARSAEGFAACNFVVDWENQVVTCPQGCTSHSWTPYINKHQNEVIKVQFSQQVCGQCGCRPQCTRGRRRSLQLQPQAHQQALQVARERETTMDYVAQYRKRAGIEGTISQGVRAFGLRRARYIGLAKTRLQHILTATAINFVRLADWLQGKPLAKTRQSRFTRLMAGATT